jgi:hypothetical protein
MTQAKTAERAHELVIAEVERSTKQYTDAHGRPLPAHDIAAGVVLKLVTAGLLRDDTPAVALHEERWDYVFVDLANVYHKAVRPNPHEQFGPACNVPQSTAYMPANARLQGATPCTTCLPADEVL